MIKRIAVLTSGGDAPGMNAAIRAVVRSGIESRCEVLGVKNGFAGLISGDWQKLSRRDVGGIMHQGGTTLGSTRCLEFKTDKARITALQRLQKAEINSLIIIGGNGSQTGAYALSQLGYPVVGIASTIDNDLYGTDQSLGVDTALNVALESIDRLRNTAVSLHRTFLVEVMGRDSGYLALMAAIAGGAETVILPESEITPEELATELSAVYKRGKSHAIVVVAEGSRCNSEKIISYFRQHHEQIGFKMRATILGHVQRGGNPNAYDRIMGTQLGIAAVEVILENRHGILLGKMDGRIAETALKDVISNRKQLDPVLIEQAQVLAK